MSFDDRKFEKFDNQKFARIEIGPKGDEVGILEGETTLPALNLNEGGVNASTNKVQTAFNFSATDGIANQAEAVISFLHVPSNIDVYFKAFITTFSDTFSPSYNEETVFGRTDPIYTFKNTTRSISLNWKVPAESYSEAYENLAKAQTLAKMVYPNYTSVNNALTLTQTPLVRLKVMNLLAKTQPMSDVNAAEQPSTTNRFKGYRSTADSTQGALGVIKSITILHNLENFEAGVLYAGPNTVLPKLIEINISFDVIHEETLGWTTAAEDAAIAGTTSTFIDRAFPYNMVSQMPIDADALNQLSSYQKLMYEKMQEDFKQDIADQQSANARARYDTMGGKARYKKDQKRMNRLAGKEDLSKAQQERFDYLAHTTNGQSQRIADGEVSEDFLE
jgi:hypothetical protein